MKKIQAKKRVVILGSTGSVGLNTLRVIREQSDRFEVMGLAAGSRADLLEEQIDEFAPQAVYLKDPPPAFIKTFGRRLRIFTEKEGLAAFSSSLEFDVLMAASSGISGLASVMQALEKGRRVALANKEILVAAGHLVMPKVSSRDGLLPVDSEHSAIFQCLDGARAEEVERLILTASGGPLWKTPERRFPALSKEEVTRHPKWKMGKKISVDSATMMNKGLEVIEARWLFGLPPAKIDVLIHPEAVIHSMVEFVDGAVIAQMGVTDMKLPIQYALTYPERRPAVSLGRVDFTASPLTFAPPDRKKFPCLDLAYEAAAEGGSAPCVLCAADEAAVQAYLDDQMEFTDIPRAIETALSKHRRLPDPDFFQIQELQRWTFEEVKKMCRTTQQEAVG